MIIDEKNTDVVIDALVTKIRSLEVEIWCKDEQIKKLKAELEKKENGNDGKL